MYFRLSLRGPVVEKHKMFYFVLLLTIINLLLFQYSHLAASSIAIIVIMQIMLFLIFLIQISRHYLCLDLRIDLSLKLINEKNINVGIHKKAAKVKLDISIRS